MNFCLVSDLIVKLLILFHDIHYVRMICFREFVLYIQLCFVYLDSVSVFLVFSN